MNLRILREAEEESLQAALWYDGQLQGLGDDFLVEYAAALEVIEDNPLRFGRLETLSSNRNIRRCLLKRFPYVVIYEVLSEEIVVLAVAHGNRRPEYWRHRRPS